MRLAPKRIIIENEAADSPIADQALACFGDATVTRVERASNNRSAFSGCDLIIAKQRGRFLKRCPGTPVYNCCRYFILNLGIGCDYDCSYCYLHYYMNSPWVIYANIDDLLSEVRDFCEKAGSQMIRLGSGEFIDSVGFDAVTGMNGILVPEFSRIHNLTFEIKTKSASVDDLLELDHRGRVVLSWSLNSLKVASEEEPEADPVEKRVEAAAKCESAGYRIGFHFDPIIFYEDWKNGYEDVVEMIFKSIDPGRIAWISLGTLRFNPDLKPIIKQKFPKSKIIYEEMVPGLDGKLRYFITIRREIYAFMVERIRSFSKEVPVYLCMESNQLAQEVGAIINFGGNCFIG